jgi:NAD(P) transhydrogenase
METRTFDLLVIGSGPAGQKAAIAAAKHKKRVAIVDKKSLIGGVSLHSGTIPSKTLREAILYLTGFRQRSFYGADYTLKDKITVADLNARVRTVIERELAVIVGQLRRNNIEILQGQARFVDPHTLRVESEYGSEVVRGENILIACGTRPARSPDITFDGKRVLLADQLGGVAELPENLIVVGGGVIGLEYASMFATLGIRITLLDLRPTVLDFADEEIIDALLVHMRELGTTFRLGEKVTSVAQEPDGRVLATTESGKRIHGDMLLYTVGRQVNTDTLDLANAGLTADDRGRIAVNPGFQTVVPHIYAAGDVIGFPALASASMEQGRIAANCMFDPTQCKPIGLLPYGIYTIPEISMIGKSEGELTRAKTPYESGVARFSEIAKGQMVGDQSGMLKLLFDPVSLELLGVHVIGDNATEIIHIGQAVMALGGTIEYFRDAVFNYPTFAEAYKVAAWNGLNKR